MPRRWVVRDGAARRVLFASNGHGEDSIAGKIIDRLSCGRDDFHIDAWPMVGRGEAYRSRGIPTLGPTNMLPSEGFGTLSLGLLVRDLRGGWIRTHLAQLRAARALRGRYDFVVAVGDIVPIAAAALTRAPFVLVGCAKSVYYDDRHAYTGLEKRLLHRRCRAVFPRDVRTAAYLERARVPTRFVGNPMMDDLEPGGQTFGLASDDVVIACLPGSRSDAVANAMHLLRVAACTARAHAGLESLHFLLALPAGFGAGEVERRLAASRTAGDERSPEWSVVRPREDDRSRGIVLRLQCARSQALLVENSFADVLHRASLALGVAGTANEQAIGLGKPLVTFATRGVQGPAYVRMKMRFFGESALRTSPEPERAAADLVALLNDAPRQARMRAAGRERMGGPGASEAIASAIREMLA